MTMILKTADDDPYVEKNKSYIWNDVFSFSLLFQQKGNKKCSFRKIFFCHQGVVKK